MAKNFYSVKTKAGRVLVKIRGTLKPFDGLRQRKRSRR